MKTSILGVLCGALAALILGPTASAGTLIYEPFDYPAGQPIAGQVNPSSGNTWNQAGAATTPVHSVASPGLTTPPGFAPASGNAADLVTTDNTQFDRLDIPNAFNPDLSPKYGTNSTLYYSALVNVPSLTGLTIANTNLNANNDLIIAFNNGQGAQASRPSNWAGELVIRGGQAATPFTTYNLGIRGSSTTGGTTYFSGDLNPGQTYLVVVRYTQGPDGSIATDDSNSLWIDPSPSTYGAAVAPAPDGSSNGSINIANPSLNYVASLLIGAGISSGSNPSHVSLDEIRVGTTWNSVVVPEPATISVLGIGAVVGLLVRRRRAA